MIYFLYLVFRWDGGLAFQMIGMILMVELYISVQSMEDMWQEVIVLGKAIHLPMLVFH